MVDPPNVPSPTSISDAGTSSPEASKSTSKGSGKGSGKSKNKANTTVPKSSSKIKFKGETAEMNPHVFFKP